MKVSSFITSIQLKFNDYSTPFQNMIYESLNNRIEEMEAQGVFIENRKMITLTLSAGVTNYKLSANEEVVRLSNMVTNKLSNGISNLAYMSLERYARDCNTRQPSYSPPTNFIPVDEETMIVYPTPDQNYTLSAWFVFQHPFLSAGTQTLSYTDDKKLALKFGVISDLYEDRGDDRFALYAKRYKEAVKNAVAKQRRNAMGQTSMVRSMFMPTDRHQ